MCNIAGYVGSRQATPILIEMMKKQEGWDAGYLPMVMKQSPLLRRPAPWHL